MFKSHPAYIAHIIPEGWQTLEATGAAQREIETLAVLASDLPDTYTVYHGVHWKRVNQGHALIKPISRNWTKLR